MINASRRYSLTKRERRYRPAHASLTDIKHLRIVSAVHHPDRGLISTGFLLPDGSGNVSVSQLGGGYHRDSTLRTYEFGPGGALRVIRRLDPYRD